VLGLRLSLRSNLNFLTILATRTPFSAEPVAGDVYSANTPAA